MSVNSFNARTSLTVGDESVDYFSLKAVEGAERLPREILPKNGYELRIEQASRVPGPPVVVTPAARRLIAGLYDADFRRFGYAP